MLKKYYWLSLLILCGLTSCMDVATTGAQALYNQHSIRKNLNDQYITMQAFQGFHYKTKDFNDANLTVSTHNGIVLLAGQVPAAWQREKAEQIVKEIPNVREVRNLITLSSPSSTLTRLSDTWITAKVKAKLIASADLDATQIKVLTENGTVYLMGTLPNEEAEAAVELASETAGVQKVVKVFYYMNISKKPIIERS